MSLQLKTINLGAYANDGTGDDLRTAFAKVNLNFNDINENLAPKLDKDLNPKLGGDLNLNGFKLKSNGPIRIESNQVVVTGTLQASQFIGQISDISNHKLDELVDVDLGDERQIEDGNTIVWNTQNKKWIAGKATDATLRGNLDGGSALTIFSDSDPDVIDGGDAFFNR
jgi:hypothetical protein